MNGPGEVSKATTWAKSKWKYKDRGDRRKTDRFDVQIVARGQRQHFKKTRSSVILPAAMRLLVELDQSPLGNGETAEAEGADDEEGHVVHLLSVAQLHPGA